MPQGIRLLLPPGFRDDGYYMNGIPVSPKLTMKDIFNMLRPYQIIIERNGRLSNSAINEYCKESRQLWKIHRLLSPCVIVNYYYYY
jgi:hypothetical protein